MRKLLDNLAAEELTPLTEEDVPEHDILVLLNKLIEDVAHNYKKVGEIEDAAENIRKNLVDRLARLVLYKRIDEIKAKQNALSELLNAISTT